MSGMPNIIQEVLMMPVNQNPPDNQTGGAPNTKPLVSDNRVPNINQEVLMMPVNKTQPDNQTGGMPNTKPLVSVIVCGMNSKREEDDRVLVDSGANEVVRPYNSSWWNEIMVFRNKGRLVTVKLAGTRKLTQR